MLLSRFRSSVRLKAVEGDRRRSLFQVFFEVFIIFEFREERHNLLDFRPFFMGDTLRQVN